jgi:hypothetical protein
LKYGSLNLLETYGPVIGLFCLFTPWSRILLEKLTGLKLVKKFPHVLWNPKVNYPIRRCSPPALILNQLDSVHTPTSHFPLPEDFIML